MAIAETVVMNLEVGGYYLIRDDVGTAIVMIAEIHPDKSFHCSLLPDHF